MPDVVSAIETSLTVSRFILSTTAAAAVAKSPILRLSFGKGTGWCYAKLKRKTGDFATAAVAVLLTMKRNTVKEVSIALTNAGATALKAREAEDSLRGNKLDDAAIAEAARFAMSICDPAADQRGDVEYKTAMTGEMTQRALRTARERAK